MMTNFLENLKEIIEKFISRRVSNFVALGKNN